MCAGREGGPIDRRCSAAVRTPSARAEPMQQIRLVGWVMHADGGGGLPGGIFASAFAGTIHTRACTHTNTHARARARAHTHTHPPARTYRYTCTHAHSLTHSSAHAHAHTHTHTHTHALSLFFSLSHTHTEHRGSVCVWLFPRVRGFWEIVR